jgi:hypothetical protein
MKITVHNPCNEHTRYYRNYNLFWDKLTDELKKKYEVTENRYFEFANSQRFPIQLKKATTTPDNFVLLECEYVIEFDETGDFYVLSVSDGLTHAILNEQTNPHLKKVLVSQFSRNDIKSSTGDNFEKYHPWIYFPSDLFDLNPYIQKRKEIETLVDKMFFKGSSLEDRTILKHISTDYLDGVGSTCDQNCYFSDLINYKIGLSVAGRGELCYRDIEYMALGIPFLRFEYTTDLNPNLKPNFHYISIPRPEDLIYDRLGTEEHGKMIEKRFLEVKDDKDFLFYISDNATKYYESYLAYDNNIKHTLNLLNI